MSRMTPTFWGHNTWMDLPCHRMRKTEKRARFGKGWIRTEESPAYGMILCLYFSASDQHDSLSPGRVTTASVRGRPPKMVPRNTTLNLQGKREFPCQGIPGHFRGGEVCLNKTQSSRVATICLFPRSSASVDTWMLWSWSRWSSLQMAEKG